MSAFVDRLCATLGARQVVALSPGMGWFLVEVIPAVIWLNITGIMSFEVFYLVAFLGLLGADTGTLAWVPFSGYAGMLIGILLTLRRHGDPKGDCLRLGWWARLASWGLVLWPLAVWGVSTLFDMSPPSWLLVSGVLVAFGVGCGASYASLPGWAMWSQMLVPPAQRGTFHAFRMVVSFIGTMGTVFTISWILPRDGANDPSQLPLLGGILLGVSVIGTLGWWWLKWVPDPPPLPAEQAPTKPLLAVVRDQPGLRRLLLWNAANTAILAMTLPFIPKLVTDLAQVATGRYAAIQTWCFFPAFIVTAIASVWLLRKAGTTGSLMINHISMLIADGLTLALAPASAWWLLPLILVLQGISKGLAVAQIARLQELTPPGDSRVMALFWGIGGAAGICTAIVLIPGVPMLEAHVGPSWAIWTVVACGVGLRLLSLPLARPVRTA